MPLAWTPVAAVLVTVLTLVASHGRERERATEGLQAAAAVMALRIDAYAVLAQQELDSLGGQAPAEGEDLSPFYDKAGAVMRAAGIDRMQLVMRSGEQVHLTRHALRNVSAPPPATAASGSAATAADPAKDAHLRVEVHGNLAVRAITARLDPATVRRALRGVELAPGWSATVLDARDQPVVRWGAPRQGEMQRVLKTSASGGTGLVEAADPGGAMMVTAYARSAAPGWTTLVSVERNAFLPFAWQPWHAGFLGLLALSLVPLWLARRGSNRILASLEALRTQAAGLASGGGAHAARVEFAEARALGASLGSADLQMRRASSQVRRLEAQLEAILHVATDVILVLDASHHVVVANDAAARAFRLSRQKIMGMPMSRLLSAETFASYLLQAGTQRNGQAEPKAFELGRCRRHDGSSFPIEYALVAFPAGAGRRSSMLVARDITQRLENAELHRMHHEFQAACFKEAEATQAALARELHDAVASSLAGAGLLLGSARTSTRDQSAAALIATAQELVKRSMQQIRQISRGMMPAGHENGALLPAMEQFAAETNRLPGVSCSFASRGNLAEVSGEVGVHLFRIAQEATNNALRHGKATRLRIVLSRIGERCRLTIQDDGSGCDPRTLAAPSAGIGIRSMRARAEAIGGSLSIRSRLDAGCRVQVTWIAPPSVTSVRVEVEHA